MYEQNRKKQKTNKKQANKKQKKKKQDNGMLPLSQLFIIMIH